MMDNTMRFGALVILAIVVMTIVRVIGVTLIDLNEQSDTLDTLDVSIKADCFRLDSPFASRNRVCRFDDEATENVCYVTRNGIACVPYH